MFTLYEGTDTTGAVVGTCTVDADGDCLPTFDSLAPGTYTIDETTRAGRVHQGPGSARTRSAVAVRRRAGALVHRTWPLRAAWRSRRSTTRAIRCRGRECSHCSHRGHRQRTHRRVPRAVLLHRPTASRRRARSAASRPARTRSTRPWCRPGTRRTPTFPKNITIAQRRDARSSRPTDPRKFKTIVLVCNEVDDTLYPSAITIDGEPASATRSRALPAVTARPRDEECAVRHDGRARAAG